MANDDYQVGYGKPPKATQFKKGASGNPKGRPKGSFSLNALVLKAAEKEMEFTEQGQARRSPRLSLIVEQLFNKAIIGNLPATRECVKLTVKAEEERDARLEVHSPANSKLRLELLGGFHQRNEPIDASKEAQHNSIMQSDDPEEEWPINVIR